MRRSLRLLFLLLPLLLALPLLASGPYTAFTYGDPGAINVTAPPYMVRSGVAVAMVNGLPISNAFYPVPFAPTISGGVVGSSYTETWSVSGGTGPYSWTCTDPSNLPPGLSFSAGTLSGTASTVGSYSFHVQVTDVNGNSSTQQFTVVISTGGSGAANSGWVS